MGKSEIPGTFGGLRPDQWATVAALAFALFGVAASHNVLAVVVAAVLLGVTFVAMRSVNERDRRARRADEVRQKDLEERNDRAVFYLSLALNNAHLVIEHDRYDMPDSLARSEYGMFVSNIKNATEARPDWDPYFATLQDDFSAFMAHKAGRKQLAEYVEVRIPTIRQLQESVMRSGGTPAASPPPPAEPS